MTTETTEAGISPDRLEYEQYHRREIALNQAVQIWEDRTPASSNPKDAVLDTAKGFLEFLNGSGQ